MITSNTNQIVCKLFESIADDIEENMPDSIVMKGQEPPTVTCFFTNSNRKATIRSDKNQRVELDFYFYSDERNREHLLKFFTFSTPKLKNVIVNEITEFLNDSRSS